MISLMTARAYANEFTAEVLVVMANKNGIYFQVDEDFPSVCKESPSSYIFIPANNSAAISLITSNIYSHFKIRVEYDNKSLDCISTMLGYCA